MHPTAVMTENPESWEKLDRMRVNTEELILAFVVLQILTVTGISNAKNESKKWHEIRRY